MELLRRLRGAALTAERCAFTADYLLIAVQYCTSTAEYYTDTALTADSYALNYYLLPNGF